MENRVDFSYLVPREIQPDISKWSIRRDEVEHAKRDERKGVLVNTHTFTWVYTRTLKEGGKKRCISCRLSNKAGCCLPTFKKYRNYLWKPQGKVRMRRLGTMLSFLINDVNF
jgi:hypothetical protein